jgi:hypothetical protein
MTEIPQLMEQDSPQKTQKDKKHKRKKAFCVFVFLCFLSFCVFCGESPHPRLTVDLLFLSFSRLFALFASPKKDASVFASSWLLVLQLVDN